MIMLLFGCRIVAIWQQFGNNNNNIQHKVVYLILFRYVHYECQQFQRYSSQYLRCICGVVLLNMRQMLEFGRVSFNS